MPISVVEPVQPAIDWTRRMLFRPFNLNKWVTVGFCVWLAYMGQGGGVSFPGNFGGKGGRDPSAELNRVFSWFRENLILVVTVGAILVVLSLVLGLLMAWVSSRGRFMFLDNVVRDRAEIREPWAAFRAEGNSLFLFRLAFGLLSFLAFAAVVGGGVLLALPSIRAKELLPAGLAAIVAGGFLLLVLAVGCGLVLMFTEDFAVPIMYLRRCRALAAWHEVWSLIGAHPGTFVLYVLFKIVIGMAVGTISLLVFCATCCCLAILPFLWAVVLLPLFVFMRAYSLHFLGQFHPGYRLLPAEVLDGPQGMA